MNVFKTEKGAEDRFPINEREYSMRTNMAPKFIRKNRQKENIYYAICPSCENPIRIIGLYKKTDSGIRPYGKHNQGDVAGLSDYDEDAYYNCPYSKPDTSKSELRRKPDSKTGNELLHLLYTQYDRIIYILKRSIHINISHKFAEKILTSYMANEGWCYYDSTKYNLPYMLLYAEPATSLFGRHIYKNSGLYDAVNSCPKLICEDINENYAKVKSAEEFTNVVFYLSEHNVSESETNLEETFVLKVICEKDEIYRETITVDFNELKRLMDIPEIRAKRDNALLDIAQSIIKW